MWRSKLNNEYPKREIEALDKEHHTILKKLRSEDANKRCVECGTQDVTWAVVNIGAFICMRCSNAHRGVGAHVSKVKGCSGTYLWGPDEIEMMLAWGNKRVNAIYDPSHTGGFRLAETSSDQERLRHVQNKYEKKTYQPPSATMKGNVEAFQKVTKSKPSTAAVSEPCRNRAPERTQGNTSATKTVGVPLNLSDDLFNTLFNDNPISRSASNAPEPNRGPNSSTETVTTANTTEVWYTPREAINNKHDDWFEGW